MLNAQRKYSEIPRLKLWKDYSNLVVLKVQFKYWLDASETLAGIHEVKTILIKTLRHIHRFYYHFLTSAQKIYNSVTCTYCNRLIAKGDLIIQLSFIKPEIQIYYKNNKCKSSQ